MAKGKGSGAMTKEWRRFACRVVLRLMRIDERNGMKGGGAVRNERNCTLQWNAVKKEAQAAGTWRLKARWLRGDI